MRPAPPHTALDSTTRRPWWSTRSTRSQAGGNTGPWTESPRRGSCQVPAGPANPVAGPANRAAAPANPAAGPANPAAGSASLGNLRTALGDNSWQLPSFGFPAVQTGLLRPALLMPKSRKYTAQASFNPGDRCPQTSRDFALRFRLGPPAVRLSRCA